MRTFSVPIVFLGMLGAVLIFWSIRVATKPEAPGPLRVTSALAENPAALVHPEILSGLVAGAVAPATHAGTVGPLDPYAPGARGQMPLLVAALAQDWEMVRRLMAADAPVEIADNLGFTPLMAAAMHGNAEIVRAFLGREAKPQLIDISGRSALHYAIAARHAEVVELLLPVAGAMEGSGEKLLQLALEMGDTRIVRTLLGRLPPTLPWNTGTQRALTSALASGDDEFARLLMSKHPTPPMCEGRNVPLLANAIATGDGPLFVRLLACGADPNTILPLGSDPAFMARLRSKFLRHYVEEEKGVTLLMLAAGLGKDDFVQALLRAGADRNRSTARDKMLALYFAARSESWKCVQTLLGSGPMPDELRVEIDLMSQRAAVIKEGVAIFTTECSTGRKGYPTPAGRFVITDKDLSHRSTIYKVAMPYFMRLNCRDFGLHEGVVSSHNASHGCIRLPSAAARKLFAELPVGTVVYIN